MIAEHVGFFAAILALKYEVGVIDTIQKVNKLIKIDNSQFTVTSVVFKVNSTILAVGSCKIDERLGPNKEAFIRNLLGKGK